jgi:hypothetical protein
MPVEDLPPLQGSDLWVDTLLPGLTPWAKSTVPSGLKTNVLFQESLELQKG